MSTTIRTLEAIWAAAAAATIGFLTGLGLSELGIGDTITTVTLAASAGINGLFGGIRQVYKWRSVPGWFAFVADSSWALISTTLGNILNVANLFWPDSEYRADFSKRRNRHVFRGGFALKPGFANTQGCVISNAGKRKDEPLENQRDFIENHEGLHVWQQRWFGPLYPLGYLVWAVIGLVVAIGYWVFSPRRRAAKTRLGRLVETAAYYDNPFEYWAYKNDDHWETNSAEPALKWRRLKRAGAQKT
jgi:hypothetical protein